MTSSFSISCTHVPTSPIWALNLIPMASVVHQPVPDHLVQGDHGGRAPGLGGLRFGEFPPAAAGGLLLKLCAAQQEGGTS